MYTDYVHFTYSPLFNPTGRAIKRAANTQFENKNTKDKMTHDIFDNKIFCNHCNKEMQKANVAKNGFVLRAVVCPKCNHKLIHPVDEHEYNKFVSLKNKQFHVKMRLVGNSYAVSIPKEIVSFMRTQEKMMDDMVKLCFEDFGRLSLNFGELNQINELKKINEIKKMEKEK